MYPLRSDNWKVQNWSDYHSSVHVVRLAHNSADKLIEGLCYEVKRNLSIQVAEKPKREGVPHFIYMSSIFDFRANEIIFLWIHYLIRIFF